MTGGRRARTLRRIVLALFSAAFVCASVAAPAWAGDQFTIDSHPSSFGAVVSDSAGNGYVAWEHAGTGGASDTPMFCKLAPGARRCTNPIKLSLPGISGYSGAELNGNEVFPILGPGSVVWVVTSRYVADDTVIWTSTDGGRTFGAPHEIPYIPFCSQNCPPDLSVSYSGLTNVDDMSPVLTSTFATYDRQVQGGPPSVYWLESSFNPGLGFNFDGTSEVFGGSAGVSEFTFGNTGGGGVAGSALGTTTVGEVVEAYWLLTTPPKLAYYYFREPAKPIPISPQQGWVGPVSLGAGYLPRMADGTAGLFLLSADSIHNAAVPNAVDIRKYSTTTHTFGAPQTLVRLHGSDASLFDGGGMAENYGTGELAAAWPHFSTGAGLMRLYLSTDGGARFSPAQDIATVGGGYPGSDNARVAIADNGTGFVTFEDSSGLQVSDLYPLGSQWRALHRKGRFLKVPVTCPAPKGRCTVKITLSRKHVKLASGHSKLRAGVTKTLTIPLDTAGLMLLASHRGRPTATLTVVIHPAGASAHTTSTKVTF